MDRERDESSDSDEEEKTAPPDSGKEKDKSAPPTVAMDIITEEEEEEEDNDDRENSSIQKQGNFAQGSNRLEKYFNLESFLEKLLKIKYAWKSTGKSCKGLEKSLISSILCRN